MAVNRLTYFCRDCYTRMERMERHFCWLPTKVYWLHDRYWQDGCRWLTFVLRDPDDGRCYVEEPR